MKKVLLIDNYDSFVFNLARYVNQLGCETIVKRNDDISLPEVDLIAPSHIIISPGPKSPSEAGISMALVKKYAGILPILGVCLGHQAIAQVFGAKIIKAKHPMHGKASLIQHDGKNLFKGLSSNLKVGRYHSLMVSDKDFPSELKITSRCDRGEIMSIEHKEFPVFGVQFHPESVLTEHGYTLLMNFLNQELVPKRDIKSARGF